MTAPLRPGGQLMPFLTRGNRFAVGVSRVARPLTDPRTDEALGFVVVDPDDHPANVGPIALLERDAVEELHRALGDWLDGSEARP